jgi:hypothetical protein
VEHRLEVTTDVNARLNDIVSSRERSKQLEQQERDLRSERNSLDSKTNDEVIALAKNLFAGLGMEHACRLRNELMTLTNYRPPVAVPKDG